MPPEQSQAPVQPEQNPYGFFLNPPPAPKAKLVSKLPLPKDPFLRRLTIVAGGGVLLIIVVSILFGAIFSGSSKTPALLAVAQEQNELIHISTTAASEATSQTTKNLALNTELVLMSDQTKLLVYAKAHGQGFSTKQLTLTQSGTTDQQLTNAQSASNFDTVYAQIVQTQLLAYQSSLNLVFKGTKDKTGISLLKSHYANASSLLAQAKAASAITSMSS